MAFGKIGGSYDSHVELDISSMELDSIVKGLDLIRTKFSERKANTEINKIVFDAAKPMMSVAKSTAPINKNPDYIKNKPSGYKPKTLQKSIGRWRTKTGVRVGARFRQKDTNKGWYIHLASYKHQLRGGSATDKASPFLANAFESTKNLTFKLIIEGIKKKLGKYWSKSL